MNKTRKQIADLIGVKTRESDYGILNGKEVRVLNGGQYVDIEGIVTNRKGMDVFPVYKFINDFEYDITAVLKYVNAIVRESNIRDTEITQKYIKISIKGEVYIETLNIPNKPLHIYTEQEDKNLLELLLEIGKQK